MHYREKYKTLVEEHNITLPAEKRDFVVIADHDANTIEFIEYILTLRSKLPLSVRFDLSKKLLSVDNDFLGSMENLHSEFKYNAACTVQQVKYLRIIAKRINNILGESHYDK